VRSSTRLVDQTTGWLKNVASNAASVTGPGDGFRDARARYPQLREPDQIVDNAQGKHGQGSRQLRGIQQRDVTREREIVLSFNAVSNRRDRDESGSRPLSNG
jgi:hypothetical protein